MTQICYLLLVHKDPDSVIAQAEALTSVGANVVIHFDLNAGDEPLNKVKAYFGNHSSVVFAERVRGGWGDWSLVQATINMARAGLYHFPRATHFYLMSGDCAPIQPYRAMTKYLSENNVDIIETADFFTSGWIKTGISGERIFHYNFLNERKYKPAFYFFHRVQRQLRVKRKIPEGLRMHIGSQWWCLRRASLKKVIDHIDARPDIPRFFRYTWIPDETFFQTLIATLTPSIERVNRPATFFHFSDYGLPTVFYNDHEHFLLSQQEFFARKVAPSALDLRKKLWSVFRSPRVELASGDRGRQTIGYVAYSGRDNQRYGERNWVKGARVPAHAKVYVITSKKWHIGNWVADSIGETLGIRSLGFVFDEDNSRLGWLGGFEKGPEKRRRNPAAFLRTVLHHFNEDEIIICADPSRASLLKKLEATSPFMRVIDIENFISDDYLEGHISRLGLMSVQINASDNKALRDTLIQRIRVENEQLTRGGFGNFQKLYLSHSKEERAEIIGYVFNENPEKFVDAMERINFYD